MKTALTIAGSDSSGGAGIQADIKTMTLNGVYAMSAITALTAQNTMGVTGIYEVSDCFLAKQIDAVFSDIIPDGVKIGMVSSAKLIKVISEKLRFYHAQNIVVDPVMIATSGAKLIEEEAVNCLKKELFPIATLITPNIPEAEVIAEMKIANKDDMIKVAAKITETFGCSVLLKGGHRKEDADDLLYYDGKYKWFLGERVNTKNTHGTGCTLSSAICSNLAKGLKPEDSVRNAKIYLSGALKSGLDLGKGNGPINHAYCLKHFF